MDDVTDQRYGPQTQRVAAFMRALKNLSDRQWAQIEAIAGAATWRFGAATLARVITDHGLRGPSMIAFDDAAFATRVALLGPTDLSAAEVVQWTLQGGTPFGYFEGGDGFKEMAAKRLANTAGFASNALMVAENLDAATFDHLYRPFASQIPVSFLAPSVPAASALIAQPIPAYLSRRVRKDAPHDCAIVKGSTPVISFGDLRHAAVATLGMNPSRKEFQANDGRLLSDSLRRFETIPSLGVKSLQDAPASAVGKVVASCEAYFDAGHHPYRRWFDQLEPILRAVGASYYDRTACHLDLVQWSTSPVWRGLGASVKRRLLDDGAPFLREQLGETPIRTLLINGSGVATIFQDHLEVRLVEAGTAIEEGRVRTRFSTCILGNARVVAWSTNLQSSFGVTRSLRERLASRVAALVGDG